MNKKRIEGAAKQGEQAPICKALVTKARWRRCGDCVVKVCVLTREDLAYLRVDLSSRKKPGGSGIARKPR
jgi:hypothetical protein